MFMKNRLRFMLVLVTVCIAISGCAAKVPGPTVATEPEEGLYFVRGYRSDDDPCKLTGETAFTNPFLDHSADLVSCPEGYGGLADFVTMMGAKAVAEKDGFVLFRVPRS